MAGKLLTPTRCMPQHREGDVRQTACRSFGLTKTTAGETRHRAVALHNVHRPAKAVATTFSVVSRFASPGFASLMNMTFAKNATKEPARQTSTACFHKPAVWSKK